MATEQYVNDPGTSLAAAITSTSATTLTVASGTGYPSGGNFRIKVDSELMLVTGVSGTTWTVTRGIESTAAATHLSGASVNAVFTAGGITTGCEQQANKDTNGGYVGRASDGSCSVLAITANPVVNYSYSNSGGSGNRVSIITVTSDGVGGATTNLVDGTLTDFTDYFRRDYATFDFGVGNSVCIVETTMYVASGPAVMTWYGSNDNSTWTTLGTASIGSTSPFVDTSLSANTTFYRYYKMVNTSGGYPQFAELNFKLQWSLASTAAITTIGKASLSGQVNISGPLTISSTATALTPSAGDNSTNVATTAFVHPIIPTYGTFASLPSSGLVAGTTYWFTDSIYDRAIYDGSAWHYFMGGHERKISFPTLTAMYGQNTTSSNVTSVTTSQGGNNYLITPSSNPSNVLEYITYPSAPFTLDVAGFLSSVLYQASGRTIWFGIGISDGTKMEALVFRTDYSNSGVTAIGGVSLMTGSTWASSGFTANVVGPYNGTMPFLNEIGLRFYDNNTNRIWSISFDGGTTYQQVSSESRTNFVTPTRIGLLMYTTPDLPAQFWATHWYQH